MKKVIYDGRKIAFVILCSVCILYFFCLYRFYNIDYFVPDFSLYQSMAVANRKAADGFSSLFIWISSLCSIMPGFINFISLLMMCLAVFNIMLFYYVFFWENLQKFIFVVVTCMSCGVWYYFYGKVFYDIPFSVYNYSLCLLIFIKVIYNREDGGRAQRWWYFLSYLLGLMMSWKPYNIFMLAGAGLLVLAYDGTRNEVCALLNGFKKICASGIIFLVGYVTGNFNIFFFPKETVQGIRAYPVSYVFSDFMLDKHRIIWDHVNDLPFSISVFSVVLLIFAGIVWPLIIRKLRYLWISLFMFGALAMYISYFSPGFTWHGFSYGIYFITYILVLVRETSMEVLYRRGFKILLVFSIVIQCVVNFGYYIPEQVRWIENTEESIEVLENNETEIFECVSQLVEGFGEESYMVDNAVKRYRPYYTTALDFRAVSVGQPYIVAENVVFVDALQYKNYDGWKGIYTRENYLNDSEKCSYIIFIIPNVFESMGNVANVHMYNWKNVSDIIRADDYTIYVYNNL